MRKIDVNEADKGREEGKRMEPRKGGMLDQ